MSAIYILWLRELKRYTRSRAQIIASLGQPTALSAGAWFRPGAGLSNARATAAICSSSRPGVIGMTVLVLVDLLRTRSALGSPVRIPEGNAGGAGAAHSDHDRAHARRRTVAVIQGLLVLIVCLIAGFRPAQLGRYPGGSVVHGADRDALRGAGHGHRLESAGHAGLSAHHELPGDADLLSVGRDVPSDEPAEDSSTVITRLDPLTYGVDGLRAAFSDSRTSDRCNGCPGARRGGSGAAAAGKLLVF